MKPEQMTLQMTDGTQFDALVSVQDGILFIDSGFLVFRFRPESARQVCQRILRLVNDEAKFN
jgi:hypothetical protein